MDRFLEINLNVITDNLNKTKEYLNNKKIIGIVKGNAYGHGLIEVSKHIENDVEYLGVGLEYEAIKLREAGIKAPILILSPYFKVDNVLKYNITPTIDNVEDLVCLSENAVKNEKVIKFHLKINTGMNRFGLNPNDIDDFIETYNKLSNVEFEGIFSHFAITIDRNKKFVEKQLKVFDYCLEKLKEKDIIIKFIHMENSTAAFTINSPKFNTVRIGNALYGKANSKNLNLKSAAIVKAKILEIKAIEKGEYVGYGLGYKSKRKINVGVIPIGFSDGFEVIRETKNFSLKETIVNMLKTFYRYKRPRTQVYINGKPLNTVGKTNMQFILVDLLGTENVQVGDTVIVKVPTFYISDDVRRVYIGLNEKE